MATFETAINPGSKQVWHRLFIACALSLLLHLALLLGMPVSPARGVRDGVTMLFARLEPAPDRAPAQNFAEAAADEKTQSPPAKDLTPKTANSADPGPGRRHVPVPPPVSGSGLELPSYSDPVYYPARQLDVYPLPLSAFKLDYPAAAANARADGRLLVLLLIDEFGVVNEASIVEANPPGYFEEAALAVFRAARFSPAQKQGKPVKSRALLQVNYVYGESQAAVH